jgi:hypothetical protein
LPVFKCVYTYQSLRYKPESCRFHSRLCHCSFSLT